MNVRRGEIWYADLDPTRGSEQSGLRPVLIIQADLINRFTSTVLAIPFTTNLRRASLPSCVLINSGDGGLASDSVVLRHQMRALDINRLRSKLGLGNDVTMSSIEDCSLLTLGFQ